MANLSAAIKQIRKDSKRMVRNMATNSDLKTLVKKTRKALEAGDKKASEMLAQLQKMTDKAVRRGTITKNKASRTLSRVYSLKRSLKK